MRHLSLVFLMIPALAFGVKPLKGRAFEQGSNHQSQLYDFYSERKGNERTFELRSRFTDLQGTLLVEEEASIKDSQVVSYAIHHHQAKEEGRLEVRDKKVHFSYTKDGKTEHDTEDVPERLLVGPTVIDFIQAHWDVLMKDETLGFRFAVLDRKETVGFKVFKSEAGERDGRKTVTITMKPTSIFIAAIVRPLQFVLWTDTKDIAEIRGRTLPKKKNGDRFEDLDTDNLYTR